MTKTDDMDPDEFVNPVTGTKGLGAIMEEAIANSIWTVGSVEDEPECELIRWQIFEVNGNRHFMGYNYAGMEGRVSSKIITFDEKAMRGITRSGRVYELVDEPGFNHDADYVLSNWLRLNQLTRDDIEYVQI